MCTSPSASASHQNVARKLYDVLKSHGYNFSREAAKFHVRMAQEMEFLQRNNVWNWKAFVIHFFERRNNLHNYGKQTALQSLAERLIFLKYYLESDGGFLIHFARRVLRENGLRKHTLRFVDGVLESIFEEAIAEYLSIVTDFKERIRLSKFLELVSHKGYESKVRIHKGFPHLDPLVDLGILDYDVVNHVYLPMNVGERNVTAVFLEQFPDALCLEKIFSDESPTEPGYYKKASTVFNVPWQHFSKENLVEVMQNIESVYPEVKDEVTGLASIKSIKDIVCVLELERGVLCEWADVDLALKELKQRKSEKLRFHVNRKGEIEYIVIS